ncbi:MAG: succinate-semialdehyde dehydrogenase / glutarate-semialdehyde dehydrogenase [Miltoncostaeaceae bacterium]|jgi:succinate-semialdehyde dehydrogenase/glutarate-semialdehyde dehydrogenase|nr:succinate-semialdehyde dehydrogenase / glutarate-semialdehyde dehydrogenase [Miltoncostaeaceae bacterium]
MATTDGTRAALDAVPKRLLIGGEWRDAADGSEFEVQDPSTGEVIGSVAQAGEPDALAALDAADRAQADWAGRSPGERADVLRDAYDALLGEAETVATVMSLEMGKPLKQSHEEVSYAAAYLRWYSEEAVRVEGGYQVAPDGRRMLVMRQPLGPALAILPWNWPLVMAAREVAPALAAGCTMLLKPSKETPYSTLALADLLQRAGLPPGVLNALPTGHSGPVTDPLIADPRLRLLTFTGSGGVGQELMAKAAEHTLRLSMELGGNAPFVVFEDADLDEAIEGALLAKVRNVGESCTAANRFLVAEPLAETFAERLADRMGGLRMGPGTDPDSEVGPLVNEEQRDQVAELVDDALARGARALCGGRRHEGPGWFYPPTVLDRVPADARVLREEIFGPVAPIVSFTDEAEAVAAANDTEYGLVAYVWTQDMDRALRVSEALETGMVGLNQGVVSNPAAPFGGVKRSGFGRKGGRQGIEEYLETKYIALPAP